MRHFIYFSDVMLDNEVILGQLANLVWFTGNHGDAVLGMGGSRRHFVGTGLAPHDAYLDSATRRALPATEAS